MNRWVWAVAAACAAGYGLGRAHGRQPATQDDDTDTDAGRRARVEVAEGNRTVVVDATAALDDVARTAAGVLAHTRPAAAVGFGQ